MVLLPQTGLGRFLLAVIVLSTISYLVLNLVSFGGLPWITYIDQPIRFGLWRVCDTSAGGACNRWSDGTYTSSVVNSVFDSSKPSYVRSSQALEIISLIFYIFAAFLIAAGILGFMDIIKLNYEILFFAAAGLLFIAIVFISASLGLMSAQGRNNHTGYRDWAWWNGIAGLIVTIICFLSLIFFVFDMRFSPINSVLALNKSAIGAGNFQQNNLWLNQPPPNPWTMGNNYPPIIKPDIPAITSLNYQNYNQYPQQTYFDDYLQNSMGGYPNQYYGGQNLNPMLLYGGQSPAEQYMLGQSPSPLISSLARYYLTQNADQQYERQLLEPYMQYPYFINSYF